MKRRILRRRKILVTTKVTATRRETRMMQLSVLCLSKLTTRRRPAAQVIQPCT